MCIQLVYYSHLNFYSSGDVIEVCSAVWQCNFATDICGITQANTDNGDWTRISGETNSANTGPSNGYRGDGDHYFYFEATGQANDDTAV